MVLNKFQRALDMHVSPISGSCLECERFSRLVKMLPRSSYQSYLQTRVRPLENEIIIGVVRAARTHQHARCTRCDKLTWTQPTISHLITAKYSCHDKVWCLHNNIQKSYLRTRCHDVIVKKFVSFSPLSLGKLKAPCILAGANKELNLWPLY
jgi:hypothetical protein